MYRQQLPPSCEAMRAARARRFRRRPNARPTSRTPLKRRASRARGAPELRGLRSGAGGARTGRRMLNT
eukprot:scaffold5009_cov172-Prasinococcus_capsulatus_cf.AAC.1